MKLHDSGLCDCCAELTLYSVSQKKIHPLRFSEIFSQTVGNF